MGKNGRGRHSRAGTRLRPVARLLARHPGAPKRKRRLFIATDGGERRRRAAGGGPGSRRLHSKPSRPGRASARRAASRPQGVPTFMLSRARGSARRGAGAGGGWAARGVAGTDKNRQRSILTPGEGPFLAGEALRSAGRTWRPQRPRGPPHHAPLEPSPRRLAPTRGRQRPPRRGEAWPWAPLVNPRRALVRSRGGSPPGYDCAGRDASRVAWNEGWAG